jgi:hypothetical protein
LTTGYVFLSPNQFIETDISFDVHTRMKQEARRIYAKVEVVYTDPFIDDSNVAVATEMGRFTSANQTKDLMDAPDYKYFSLHNNKLDGSFHPLPASLNNGESVGWWGANLSDASGVLSPIPTITITFDARAIFFLKVSGDSILNEFPVDFTIKLYDPSNVVQYTETVTGNTLIYWAKNITDIGNIAKIELTITKINKPNTVPKILEFYTGVSEVYDADRVIDLNLLEEQSFDEFTLPIGNVSSNEIDIKFDNTDKHFDPRNTTSPLYGQLKKNRKVKPYLGVDLDGSGTITWYQLGLFYTTEWKAPTNDIYASLTARDRLELLKQREFTTSTVYANYNLYQLAEIILQDFGLTAKDYSIDTALQSTIVPYMWFDRVTHRAALVQIAEAGLCRLYCDRSGVLRVEVARTANASLFTFSDDETLFSTDYPLAAGQIANYVECLANPRIIAASAGTIYQSTDVVTVPANGTITQTYKFNFVPCVQVTIPTITAGGNVTIQSWTAYAWGVVVTFANSAAAAQTVTAITVSGKKLDINGGSVAVAQDAQSIHDNGKLTHKIENDFIQTLSRAQSISDTILAAYKDARHDIEMETRGHVSLQLGDRITAPGFDAGTSADYYIIRQNIKWDGALDAQVKGLKA